MFTLSTLIAAFVDRPTITNGAALTRYVRLHPAEVRSVAPRHAHIIDGAGRYAARAIVARAPATREIAAIDPRIAHRPTRMEPPRC
jgi:hypothetical protein